MYTLVMIQYHHILVTRKVVKLYIPQNQLWNLKLLPMVPQLVSLISIPHFTYYIPLLNIYSAYMHTHYTQPHTCTHTHTRACTYMHTHTHTHTRILHNQTHTHTHTRTHTHTHAHDTDTYEHAHITTPTHYTHCCILLSWRYCITHSISVPTTILSTKITHYYEEEWNVSTVTTTTATTSTTAPNRRGILLWQFWLWLTTTNNII